MQAAKVRCREFLFEKRHMLVATQQTIDILYFIAHRCVHRLSPPPSQLVDLAPGRKARGFFLAAPGATTTDL
ncbi:hypothetical protein [Variovorax sp. PBL-E5]|uniref:hypothetical protein n=1 Tax=Variovorax sp. PBL-E5 TaxID=434014 RepID=UPI0013A59308|nr:hypothetical protein [Variovorax sp. PBL-E5]